MSTTSSSFSILLHDITWNIEHKVAEGWNDFHVSRGANVHDISLANFTTNEGWKNEFSER